MLVQSMGVSIRLRSGIALSPPKPMQRVGWLTDAKACRNGLRDRGREADHVTGGGASYAAVVEAGRV